MANPRPTHENNGRSAGLLPAVGAGEEWLPGEQALEIYRLMARARALEERMIKMSKSGEGYF